MTESKTLRGKIICESLRKQGQNTANPLVVCDYPCLLQEFLLTVPYCDHTDYEGHYQQMFYIIFSLFGMYVDVEVHTPQGRVDIVMRTTHTLYIMELKLNKSAEAAMRQIDLKDYPSRFALCGLPITKVGINFDTERHTICDWKIED